MGQIGINDRIQFRSIRPANVRGQIGMTAMYKTTLEEARDWTYSWVSS
jgi:hypothetical protein